MFPDRHCKPGGWVESQEVDVEVHTDDNSLPPESYIQKWWQNQEVAIQKMGLTLRLSGDKLKTLMQDAGFVNITIHEFKVPIGTWPADPKLRETGAFQLVAMLEGLQGLTIALYTRFLGWKVEEVEVFLAKVREEWRSKSVHSYWLGYAAHSWSLVFPSLTQL